MKILKKIFKILVWALALAILIPVLLIATMPLWVGPLARPAANSLVPQFTQGDFKLGGLKINPYTGVFEVKDLFVGNPSCQSEKTAVSAARIYANLAMSTLASDCLHIEDVVVEDLFVSLVKCEAHGLDNVMELQYNIVGGKENYDALFSGDDEAKAKAEAEIAANGKEEAKAATEKKFVIDHLMLKDVKVKLGLVTLPVPTIELRDLGKETEGINFFELWQTVWSAIMKAATSLGGALGDLGEGALDLSKGAIDLGKDAGKEVLDAGKNVLDAGKDAVDAAKKLFDF